MGRVSSMGEMASVLAHELHQPLMAIVNYSQSALMDLNKDDNAERGVIKDVEHISEQALLKRNVSPHIIFITAMSDQVRERVIANGALPVFEKPFNLSKLITLLQDYQN